MIGKSDGNRDTSKFIGRNERFGDKWGFQYSEKEWNKMENDPNRYWEMEKLLEVIE